MSDVSDATKVRLADAAEVIEKMVLVQTKMQLSWLKVAAACREGDYLGMCGLIDQMEEDGRECIALNTLVNETLRLVQFSSPGLYEKMRRKKFLARRREEFAALDLDEARDELKSHQTCCDEHACDIQVMLKQRIDELDPSGGVSAAELH